MKRRTQIRGFTKAKQRAYGSIAEFDPATALQGDSPEDAPASAQEAAGPPEKPFDTDKILAARIKRAKRQMRNKIQRARSVTTSQL